MRMLFLSDRAKPLADLPQVYVYPWAQCDLEVALFDYDAIVVDAAPCWRPQLLPTRDRNRDRLGDAVLPLLEQGKTVVWLIRDYFDCRPWLDNLGIDYDPDEGTAVNWEKPGEELGELISLASLRVSRCYLSFTAADNMPSWIEMKPLATLPGKAQPVAIHCRVHSGQLILLPLFDVMDGDTIGSLYTTVSGLTSVAQSGMEESSQGGDTD